MVVYGSIYVGALLLALIATPIVVRIAHSGRILDRPGTRKVHSVAIPRIGGIAVFVAMLAVVLLLQLFDTPVARAFAADRARVIALLVTSGFVFLIGLVDDLVGMGARTKLFAQATAAAIACALGIRIDFLTISGWTTIQFGWFAWPLTIFWIVGITNAVNLIDGLDGLAAGISLIACGVILVFAVHSNNVMMSALMTVLLGSLSGFLFFNFNPAKIFLGDCGSMFLGYFLAVSSVMCTMKSSALVGLALPAVALGLPIFDTLFSILRRGLERRPVFAPDRKHIHHRLIDMGLNQKYAVIIMYGITIIAAGIGMLMILVQGIGSILLILAGALVPVLLVFRAVGAMRIREAFLTFQRNRVSAREAKGEKRGFEEMRLRLQEAETFEQWWRVLRRAAREMGIAKVSITFENPDESSRRLSWRMPDRHAGPADERMIRTTLPLDYGPDGRPLCVRIDLPVNGSMESAGRRLALFGRLFDEDMDDHLQQFAEGSDTRESTDAPADRDADSQVVQTDTSLQ